MLLHRLIRELVGEGADVSAETHGDREGSSLLRRQVASTLLSADVCGFCGRDLFRSMPELTLQLLKSWRGADELGAHTKQLKITARTTRRGTPLKNYTWRHQKITENREPHDLRTSPYVTRCTSSPRSKPARQYHHSSCFCRSCRGKAFLEKLKIYIFNGYLPPCVLLCRGAVIESKADSGEDTRKVHGKLVDQAGWVLLGDGPLKIVHITDGTIPYTPLFGDKREGDVHRMHPSVPPKMFRNGLISFRNNSRTMQ